VETVSDAANQTAAKRRQYVHGAGAGLFAKAGSIAASFAGLWLLNQILSKEFYGAYAYTLATLQLVTLLATLGLDRSVLYRLSRAAGADGELVGGAHVAWVLRVVTVTGIVTAGLAAGLALWLAPRSELPALGRWFATLAAVVPLLAVGYVFEAWYQARGRVPVALVVPRLTELSRAALLLLAFWLVPTPGGVALAAVTATAVPLVAWLVLVPRGALARPARLPAGDTAYGLKLMLSAVADRGVRRLDLLMIGTLSTAAITADYAVAAQLVTLTMLGNELLGPVFTPRMGRYFQSADRQRMAREYEQNRALTLALGLIAAIVFVAAGRPLLAVFGDYEQAWPVLLVLSAAFLVKVGFGATGRYLNMSGRAGWALSSTVALLVAMVAFNLLLIPRFGATGAALGTLLSFAGVNALHAVVIWRQDRFVTLGVEPGAVLACVVALLLGAAAGRIGPLPAALGLGLVALVPARHGFSIARNLLAARDYL
jgi:O-antigen/teichoic acid export membrane protein